MEVLALSNQAGSALPSRMLERVTVDPETARWARVALDRMLAL